MKKVVQTLVGISFILLSCQSHSDQNPSEQSEPLNTQSAQSTPQASAENAPEEPAIVNFSYKEEFEAIHALREQALERARILYGIVPNPTKKTNPYMQLMEKRIKDFHTNLIAEGLETVHEAFQHTSNLVIDLVGDVKRTEQLARVSSKVMQVKLVNELVVQQNKRMDLFRQTLHQKNYDLYAQEVLDTLSNRSGLMGHLPFEALQMFIAQSARQARDILAYKNMRKRFPEHFAHPLHADHFNYLDSLWNEGPEAIEKVYTTTMKTLDGLNKVLHKTLNPVPTENI